MTIIKDGIDLTIAQNLLKGTDGHEDTTTFLWYLSVISREGHLCLHLSPNTISPCPSTLKLWNEPGKQIPALQELAKLQEQIVSGAAKLPKELITQVSNTNFLCSTPVCQNDDRYYYQKYWHFETLFLKNLEMLEKIEPSINPDPNYIDSRLKELCDKKTLLPEQAQAIQTCCKQTITIICGGPGTGKTYTAGMLMRVLWEALTPEDRTHCKIALAAPTGKAAANLEKSLQKAIGTMTSFPTLKATTLHSLLAINSKTPISELDADLIVVDESSMIDMQLMAYLFSAIKPGARLIMLGDPYQLPPVESGNLFADLIESRMIKGNDNGVIELTKCLRAELQGIVDFSHKINAGDVEGVFNILSANDRSKGISYNTLVEDDFRLLQKQIATLSKRFQVNHTDTNNLLHAYNQFRILSPMRKGPFGVDQLNHMFLKQLMKDGIEEGIFNAPIMITSNDSRMELFNGAVGILTRHFLAKGEHDSFHEGDFAIFPANDQSDVARKIPAFLLPRYEYAYCLSVHKSQGSEFDEVLLILPEGSELFGREVLYTAATRAKKHLEIWGSKGVIRKTIMNRNVRVSGVSKRLEVIFS